MAALVLDGSGESTSGAAFRLHESFHYLWTLAQTGSLGIYYEAITQYIGFAWGEEGKTMGLAPYGRPNRVRLPPITDDRTFGNPPSKNTGPSPRVNHIALREAIIGLLRNEFGPQPPSAPDLARAGQDQVATRLMAYAMELLSEDIDVLIYSGGLALNCFCQYDPGVDLQRAPSRASDSPGGRRHRRCNRRCSSDIGPAHSIELRCRPRDWPQLRTRHGAA